MISSSRSIALLNRRITLLYLHTVLHEPLESLGVKLKINGGRQAVWREVQRAKEDERVVGAVRMRVEREEQRMEREFETSCRS